MFAKTTLGSACMMLALALVFAVGGRALAVDTRWMRGSEVFPAKEDFERLDPF